MEWPQFEIAQQLADGRSWTARFTGVDELRAVASYVLRVVDGDRITETPVEIDIPPAEDPRDDNTRHILQMIQTEHPRTDIRSQLERVAQLAGPALPYGLELAAFRRQYATAIDAIRACERPDWAFEIALAETPDRKAVISEAAHVATLLSDWDPTSLLGVAKVRHHPVVVVEAWAGGLDVAIEGLRLRGEMLAMAITLLASIVVAVFVQAWVPGYLLVSLVPVVMMIGGKLFGPACTRFLGRELRRQVAQMNEAKAIEIVFAQIETGWNKAVKKHARKPEKLSLMMRFFVRRPLARVLGDGVKRPEDAASSAT